MPDDPFVKKHVDQSQHIEGLIQKISDLRSYPDWTIVTAFYFALHRMQAALLRDFNFYPRGHVDDDPNNSRNTLVSKCYRKVAGLYLTLYNESIKARYRPGYHETNDMIAVAPLVERAIQEFKGYPEE